MKLTKKIFPELRNCLLLVTEYKPYTIYLYVDENLNIRYYDYTSPVAETFANAIFNNGTNHNHWVSETENDASEMVVVAWNLSPAEADQARIKHYAKNNWLDLVSED
nr:MAG TPA: hypothetical protein [Caudoviricetes sp.]